jgi:histidine triad (HIT) family protein
MADKQQNCLFCKIVRGEIPAKMVVNSKEIAAFRDINPQAPTHILIIPKEHIASLDDLSDSNLLGQMMSLAAALARQEGIAKTGYRAVINTGKDGGQSVDHLHIHLLGGRHMTWPPG